MISRLELTARDFDDTMACLGSQVATVVAAIERLRPHLRWYVADIDATPAVEGWTRDPAPVRAGATIELWAMAGEVHQFLMGVFAAIGPDVDEPMFRDGGLWTEDAPDDDLGNTLVEVRTFDAAFIEVMSRDEALIEALADELGGSVGPAERATDQIG